MSSLSVEQHRDFDARDFEPLRLFNLTSTEKEHNLVVDSISIEEKDSENPDDLFK